MNNIDEFSMKIMLDFLQTNFPVKRLKDGRRFRRGIVLDSGFIGRQSIKTYMAPKSERRRTFILLSKILEDVFGIPKYEINTVLTIYLNII